MNQTAVIYWSGTGNTEAMARAVLKGAQSAGSNAQLFTAAEFDPGKAAHFDAFALGCPAMGNETLEDVEFAPMFASIKSSLVGKKVALFGSYGWGDAEWMRSWEDDCAASGIPLSADSVTCNDAPDAEHIAACQRLGAALAKDA